MSDRHTYLLVGGGSGGHLTPLIPISEAIKALDPSSLVIHVGQKGDRLNDILKNVKSIDQQYTVRSAKFRRYNGESVVTKLLDFKTNLLNVRDFFYFICGTFQSWRLLRRIKPDIILTKGGNVCALVGLSAGLLKIPYVTHDSDAMVSLAHRIIAKKASLHMTAMPKEFYKKYDMSKVVQVGVPIREEFSRVTDAEKYALRDQLSLNKSDKVLLVTGGGLGAKNINDAVVEGSHELLQDPSVRIIHITGHKLYSEVSRVYDKNLDSETRRRVVCLDFTNDLYVYSGASDVLITRAGATNMAEFSAQAKACIVVPNPLLAGGHQLKNAEALKSLNSVIIVREGDVRSQLISTALNLLNDKNLQVQLADRLYQQSSKDSAGKIADQLVSIAQNNGKKV